MAKSAEARKLIFEDEETGEEWVVPSHLLETDSDFDQPLEAAPATRPGVKKRSYAQDLELRNNLEFLQARLDNARTVEEFCRILRTAEKGSLPFGQLVRQIEDLDEFYLENSDAVIVNDIVTPRLAEKDPQARLFAEKFQALVEPPGLAIKTKVKKLLQQSMREKFRANQDLYAGGKIAKEDLYSFKAIAQAKTYKQLEYIVGQFNKLTINERGWPAIYDKDDIQMAIIPAMRAALNRAGQWLQDHKGQSAPDEMTLGRQITDFLANFPQDTMGIRDKLGELLRQLVWEKSQTTAAAPAAKPRGALSFLTSRLGKLLRRK